LTSSALASAVSSSVVFCFFGVFFATTGLMVVSLSLPRLVCLGSRPTFCLVSSSSDESGSGF
jgi:hypothetical protein